MPQISIPNTMLNINISECQIYQRLIKLKIEKSPGADSLHPRVFKEVAKEIVPVLKHIFNLSLSTGTLPDDWLCSIVSVIHKKGSHAAVSNYRPISLTCIACKILESLIRDNIMSFLKQNNLFSSKQYGFIRGRTSVLQLLTLTDQWSACLEQGGQIDIIYTDFEKAFDKVPHRRLLSKLESYGINVVVIKWIEQFLCYRKHRVRINSCYSKWKDVDSGIPQGSVLGPLLEHQRPPR